MIPSNYLRARMHKSPNTSPLNGAVVTLLAEENRKLKAENEQLRRENAVMRSMQALIDAKVAKERKQ